MRWLCWRLVVWLRESLLAAGSVCSSVGLVGFAEFLWWLDDQTLPACYALHRDGFHL